MINHRDFNITNDQIDMEDERVDYTIASAVASGNPESIAVAQLTVTAMMHKRLGDTLKWMKERR